jgi:hypothetical protein
VLGRYTKVGVLALAVAVLAVEGYFVYRYYDQYYGYYATVGDAATFKETTFEETTAPKDVASGADGALFVHRATPGNVAYNSTYVDHPLANGDPNAVLLAKRVAGDPPSTRRPIGVWYDHRVRGGRWAVFNQDRSPMPRGEAFEVTILEEPDKLVHRAGPANTMENGTYVDRSLTNGKPDAGLTVTQNWNPGGVYNDHFVGIRYDPTRKRWVIYNRDGAPIPAGAAFNIAVSGDAEPAG